jgi:hypothetical protein
VRMANWGLARSTGEGCGRGTSPGLFFGVGADAIFWRELLLYSKNMRWNNSLTN